ncbi:hypothetical protein HZ326_26485 [Fusarium oxysporum f. sp. albedinis]|nr:hypothetical protein HZ326_26485 [Fusarium oxysporum f. sp. albedinis]
MAELGPFIYFKSYRVFRLLQSPRFHNLTPRNPMGEDVQYASVFSGTTKRFNNTMPLITPGLTLKIAEGPGCMISAHHIHLASSIRC